MRMSTWTEVDEAKALLCESELPLVKSITIREYYHESLLMCEQPDPVRVAGELRELLESINSPVERQFTKLTIILARLKQETQREDSVVRTFLVYVLSNYPHREIGYIPPNTSIFAASLDMIRGHRFKWKGACAAFRDTPKKTNRMNENRLFREAKEILKDLGFWRE